MRLAGWRALFHFPVAGGKNLGQTGSVEWVGGELFFIYERVEVKTTKYVLLRENGLNLDSKIGIKLNLDNRFIRL